MHPPGTVKVDGLFIDQTEITNINWLEFLYWEAKDNDSLYILPLYPDSINNWYTLRENRYRPVVLITYEQAVKYCEWRTRIVNENPDRHGQKKVLYRLPSEEEWKKAANYQVNLYFQYEKSYLSSVRDSVEKYPAYYFVMEQKHDDSNRIYNLFDNVSEMTNIKGVAMGTNNHTLPDINRSLTRPFTYDSPSRLLGFRCVAEYIDP